MTRQTLRVALVALFVFGSLLGGVAGVGAQSQTDAQPADLNIVQPSYVDGNVDSDMSGGDRIYRVTGPRHVITLANADHENVTGSGIADGNGEFAFDEGLDAYVFETAGNGTTTVYWTVTETDGNATTTQRYEASIQADETAWVHRTGSEDERLREKASKFDEIAAEVDRVAPNMAVDEAISSGLTFVRFFESPFSTLSNDMRGVLLMMALRPGGWIIAGFFIGIALLGVASGARYRNRTSKQFRDIGDIEVEKTEAYLKKAQRILSNCDYNDFLPDDAARAMRDLLGRNPWIGFKNYLLLRSPTHVKGLVLQMMAQIGYEGHVTRTPDGAIKEAWVDHPRDDDGGVSTAPDGGMDADDVSLADLEPANESDRAFIDHIPGDELDMDVFQADIDPDSVEFPISNRDVDDSQLLEELNPHFPDDFDDEEHLAQALGNLVEYVVNHNHTDEWGRSDRELDLLSFLSEMDSVLADEADFPLGHVQRRMLVYIADNMEKEAEMTETVDRLETEGVQ